MPPLYFLHIPKTSGTTLAAYLDAKFEAAEIVDAKVWSQHLANLPYAAFSPYARTMANKRFVRGHFGWGLRREFVEPPTIITMLRNPLEKTISMFHHMDAERQWNNFAPSDFYREPFSLQAVLDDNRASVLINHQTRHLGVDLDVKAIARTARNDHAARMDHPAPTPVNLDSLREFIDPDRPGPELVEQAWDNLQSCRFFGLQEYHQASVLLLADVMGWRPERIAERLMTIPGRPDRDVYGHDLIDRILEKNLLDIDLYLRAQALFFERFADLVTRILGEAVSAADAEETEPELTARCLDVVLGPKSDRGERRVLT